MIEKREMWSRKKKKEKETLWIRNFDVKIVVEENEDEKSGKKFTLYDVTSIIYAEGFPETSTKITVKKRFSQFQKFHASLKSIHKGLYLKGEFPDLPKTTFFSRFEGQVLEERRKSMLDSLNFSAKHPQLYNSVVFNDFFVPETTEFGPPSNASSTLASPETGRKSEKVAELQGQGNVMDASALTVALAKDNTPALSPEVANKYSPEEEMRNLPDYLSKAAEDVSLAVQMECEENFDASIDCYRNAIGTLLTSVQKDKCLKRQASVKRYSTVKSRNNESVEP